MLDSLGALSPLEIAIVVGVALLAGWVKGMVGFAMPMVLISGFGMVLSPELALAGLILPTLVTNGMQALGQGLDEALSSVRRFRVFLGVGLICLILGAQMVRVVPAQVFFVVIGVMITGFALMQLLGREIVIKGQSLRVEAGIGAFAGFIGGMSGVWGPPTVAYLTALQTPKADQIRIQGVIYGLGALALVGAHIGSGVLTAQTAVFSAAVVVPATAGMWVGQRMQGSMDQAAFRRATLIVLLVAGANLLRRGLMG